MKEVLNREGKIWFLDQTLIFCNGEGNNVSSSETKHVGKEKRGRDKNSCRSWKEKNGETWDKKDKGRIKKMKEQMC